MSWLNYYTLLEKYNGDLSKATVQELGYAAYCNPNNPIDARNFAEKKWSEKEQLVNEKINLEISRGECN